VAIVSSLSSVRRCRTHLGVRIDYVARDLWREETFESRFEATIGVGLVIAAQLVLAFVSYKQDWTLAWWVWLIPVAPEIALLVPLAWDRPRQRLEQIGRRRTVALGLLGVVGLSNGLMLVALLGSLIAGQEESGRELLLKGAAIFGTNVMTFGLSFWILDRGGPARRLEPDPPLPDFQFPQDENTELAPPDWHPRLLDYLYLSFTNSIAFSPTDAMPLTRWAKLLMLVESAISATTVLLVAARGINILK
jgi:hypothetical protein